MGFFKKFFTSEGVGEVILPTTKEISLDYTPLLELASTHIEVKYFHTDNNDDSGVREVLELDPMFIGVLTDFGGVDASDGVYESVQSIVDDAYKKFIEELLPTSLEEDEVLCFMPSKRDGGFVSQGVYFYVEGGKAWLEATYKIENMFVESK